MVLTSAAAFAVRAVPEVVPPQAPRNFVASASSDMTLKAAPIDPSWVLSGTPDARCAVHSRGQDDAAMTAVWDCTAGVFRWYFGWDETVMILEGEVHITAEDGTERTLRAGDVAYFAAGTWATWSIDEYVKKIAFCRKRFPKPLTMAYRLRNFIRTNGAAGLVA